jgi:hypothetical protein
MRLRILAVLALAAMASVADAQSLPEEWQRVQQALATSNPQAVQDSVHQLRETASGVQARRLTPYAGALCAWAQSHPGDDGRLALRLAAELDPDLPTTAFVLARWQWRDGAWGQATWSFVKGLMRMGSDSDSRRLVGIALLGWLLLALGGGLATATVVQTARFVRETAHDAWELGRSLFPGANAWVFAAILLVLPLFAGLGPIWVVIWLFALGWIYVDRTNRIVAAAMCVTLALIVPALEVWQSKTMRSVGLEGRVAGMLDERAIDLSTLREFSELENELASSGPYHLILGELMRMHADVIGAKIEFQKAIVAAPTDPVPHLFIGALALEDGDVAHAVQSMNKVLELDPRSVLAYRNLSFAYDQSYKFQAADAARSKADELVRQGIEERSLRGRSERIVFPRLTGAEVSALFSSLPEEVAAKTVPRGIAQLPWSELLAPPSLVFWVAAVLGGAMLAVRQRWAWTASSCIRCGRVFCPRCKSAMESASYCSQCISVFLKRDVVSIEQQSAKLAQIRRWETVVNATRRVLTCFVPGSGPILRGRLWRGAIITVVVWFLALGAVVVIPLFFAPIETQASFLPIQVLLVTLFAAIWLHSVVTNWQRR